MTPDVTTSFLTYYIRSLAERTRVEKGGTKYGFDWIIYNLALAKDLIPYRLPFFRSGPTEVSKSKTEAEFGIDSSFVSRDRKLASRVSTEVRQEMKRSKLQSAMAGRRAICAPSSPA